MVQAAGRVAIASCAPSYLLAQYQEAASMADGLQTDPQLEHRFDAINGFLTALGEFAEALGTFGLGIFILSPCNPALPWWERKQAIDKIKPYRNKCIFAFNLCKEFICDELKSEFNNNISEQNIDNTNCHRELYDKIQSFSENLASQHSKSNFQDLYPVNQSLGQVDETGKIQNNGIVQKGTNWFWACPNREISVPDRLVNPLKAYLGGMDEFQPEDLDNGIYQRVNDLKNLIRKARVSGFEPPENRWPRTWRKTGIRFCNTENGNARNQKN